MESEPSDSDNDGLPFDIDEVMAAKRNNPGMFVSAWQADEENIDQWTTKEIKLAAENGDLNTIKDMISSCNADKAMELLLAKDLDGYTALHRAVYSGRTDVLKYLIESGADINNRTEDDWTPLHSAAFWNKLSCAEMLIYAGADLHAITKSGQTPLHVSISNNQGPETLYLLLAQPGVSVYGIRNAQDNNVSELIQRNTSYADICYPFSEAATCLIKN